MKEDVKYGMHHINMSSLVINLSILFVVLILIDFYVHKGLMTAFARASKPVRRLISTLFWIAAVGFFSLLVYNIGVFSASTMTTSRPFKLLMASFVILYVPKVLFSLFLLVEDVIRLLRAIGLGTKKLVNKEPVKASELFQSRRRFISQSATILAGLPFIGGIYGVMKGKYNFRIHKAEIAYKDLPKEFDGFTITQVSDIHCGSFGDMEEVLRGVRLATAQNSDIMFFTGDMVNFRSDETDRWTNVFKELKAPMGVYSILGNHDYGDYAQWNSEQEKKANLDKLCDFHKQMGFKLMRNENLKLERNGKTIDLLGMENWGRGGFSKYGDIAKTMVGTSPDSFKILMSHDPTFWEDNVMNMGQTIHLTLSGHTHGMQYGFEIPGFIKFSPVQFRYKRWAGLYAENGRYLYVNRGFGYIGFPGRVGIWPEITVITLKCA